MGTLLYEAPLMSLPISEEGEVGAGVKKERALPHFGLLSLDDSEVHHPHP